MTTPAYYRSTIRDWIVAALIGFAVLAALYVAGRQVVTSIREDARAAVYAESTQWINGTRRVEVAAWQREREALRSAVVVADSQAGASSATARASIASLNHLLALRTVSAVDEAGRVPPLASPAVVVPSDTDVTRLAADVAAQCTAALNDCATYRATTARALGVADSLQHADAAQIVTLSFVAVAARDTMRQTLTMLSRRPSWRAVGEAGGAGVVLGAVLCLLYCR